MKRLCTGRVLRATLLVLSVVAHSSSPADGFSGFGSDHLRLKGSVVVDAGDAKEVPPPPGAEWKEQVYSLNSRCFTMFGSYFGYWGFGGKPALLIVDERETVQLALLEASLGNITVKLQLIQLVQCPEHANIVPSCDGLSNEECTKLLDEFEKKLQRRLKELGG